MLSKPYKLFIAEDDKDVAKTLSDYISAAFPNVFAISHFSTSADVLEALKAEDAKIILSDLKMPGKLGDSLLEDARAVNPSIMSVLITGYPSFSVMASAYRDGVDGFIIKPFSEEDIRRTLEPLIMILDQWTLTLGKYFENRMI